MGWKFVWFLCIGFNFCGINIFGVIIYMRFKDFVMVVGFIIVVFYFNELIKWWFWFDLFNMF